jgi:uncharacterized membrane protein YhhN
MSTFAVISVSAAAVLDWLAVACGSRKAKYLTKPLVVLLLILWLTRVGGFTWPLLAFTIGAGFSLLGDIWLMFSASYFLAGLASFLLAHIGYIAGFSADGIPSSPLYWLAVILVLAAAYIFARRMLRGGSLRNASLKLRLAVGTYTAVVTGMFLSALGTAFKPAWPMQAALPVVVGGALFYFSDALLAYDRFTRPVRHARLIVRITYHSGQLLLIAGAILQASRAGSF